MWMKKRMDKVLPKWLFYCLNLALILALAVVMLGAYTRLTHAGLGCPDWPFCYGKVVVAEKLVDQKAMQKAYPDNPLSPEKAKTEMLHRYLAGSLALLIFLIAASLIWRRAQISYALFLMALLIAQAALGMWTVTLKLLPIVVMMHLLGGILIFAVLCALALQLSSVSLDLSKWRFGIGLGLCLLFCQIALGGWVSANYAGLSCVGFPTCNGSWFPEWHFSEGFHLLSPVGANYQGGHLDVASRVTIQVVHRIGAVIVGGYIVSLSLLLFCKVKKPVARLLACLTLFLVLLQWCLGIMNVIYFLPIGVAVAHNGVAALLMATLSLFFVLCRRPNERE